MPFGSGPGASTHADEIPSLPTERQRDEEKRPRDRHAGGRDEAVVDSQDRTRACEKVTQQ